MAISAEEQARIKCRIDEEFQHQESMQKVIKEMSKLQEFVDKSGWDSFLASLLWYGGGFFLIGKYFTGVVASIVGCAIALYSFWLVVQSLLSYFFDFERNWKLAGVMFIGNIVYYIAVAIWSAIATRGVRERSQYGLQILREKSNSMN
ncbi:MAG: hypothetical protein RSD41_05235 [Kiritimatiellia bacterium]